MSVFNIIGASGQSGIEGYRSDPSLLPASDLDAKIPMNTNIVNFDTQPGWGGAAGISNGIAFPDDALIPLQPKLVSDGGGNGWTEGITVPLGKSSWGYGPEITCARGLYSEAFRPAVMKRGGSGQPLGLVGDGTGGTYPYYHNPQAPVTESWLRDKDGNAPGTIGLNFIDSINRINGMRSALQNLGHSSRVAGWLWFHGEADATDEIAAGEYGYHLTRLIEFTRAKTGFNMPWIIAMTYTGGAHTEEIRRQQAYVAATVPGVRLYDPSGLPLYSDGVHYWKGAYVEAGAACAEIFKEMGVGV